MFYVLGKVISVLNLNLNNARKFIYTCAYVGFQYYDIMPRCINFCILCKYRNLIKSDVRVSLNITFAQKNTKISIRYWLLPNASTPAGVNCIQLLRNRHLAVLRERRQ
jgi:hypothetical protein